MNCKPGDLAWIVKPDYRGDEWALGKIVTCIALYVDHGVSCWSIKEKMKDPKGVPIRGIPDDALRPIRDPGEDATDETLDWLPVPSRESEAA